jgi:hypothetical protein
MKYLSLTCLALIVSSSLANAQMVLRIDDRPGYGFNDTTPVAPLPGNSATTIGQQKIAVLQRAMQIWNDELRPTRRIVVAAMHTTQACAPLFAAASLASVAPSSAVSGQWIGAGDLMYPIALANEMFRRNPLDGPWEDLNGDEPEMRVLMNSTVGSPTCGSDVWLGLDRNASQAALSAGKVLLLPALLHELAHGLGFTSLSNRTGGIYGTPSYMSSLIWHLGAYDILSLSSMTPTQHAAAVVDDPHLVWGGIDASPYAAHSQYLRRDKRLSVGRAGVSLSMPLETFNAGRGTLGVDPVFDREAFIVQAFDASTPEGSSISDGCSALTNGAEVNGKMALIDRGTCTYVTKVRNAQNAGAVAVLIADNTAGPYVLRAGGTDGTITIPVLAISQANGNAIRSFLMGGPLRGVVKEGYFAGTILGLLRMHAPAMFSQTTSIDHLSDDGAGLLMQSTIYPNVFDQLDLSPELMYDIGWPRPR